jgi:hypothetical protein
MELKGFFRQTSRSFGRLGQTINSFIGLKITIQVNQTEGLIGLTFLFWRFLCPFLLLARRGLGFFL